MKAKLIEMLFTKRELVKKKEKREATLLKSKEPIRKALQAFILSHPTLNRKWLRQNGLTFLSLPYWVLIYVSPFLLISGQFFPEECLMWCKWMDGKIKTGMSEQKKSVVTYIKAILCTSNYYSNVDIWLKCVKSCIISKQSIQIANGLGL